MWNAWGSLKMHASFELDKLKGREQLGLFDVGGRIILKWVR
jgi:hypothetical protein